MLHLAAPPGPLAEAAAQLGLDIHELAFPRLRRSWQAPAGLVGDGLKIARLAGRIKAGAVYANTVRTAFYGALVAKLAGIPFVWHMRDFWLSETASAAGRFERITKSWLCSSASQVIANSAAVKSNLPCPKKTTVVHNGIDVEYFSPGPGQKPARKKWGISERAPVVGMVGRLRPWKGPDRFLRVMARVAQNFPTARFMLVGGSPPDAGDGFAESLPALAGQLGISERVILTGHLDDVRPALAAMDIFVHPGDPEPFGLVNIEAMAMEKPVVAFAHGALPEIVVNGETGLLLPPGDEEGMARSIFFLLNNPNEIRTMGQKGRARVIELFTIQQTVANLAAILSQLVGK